MTAVVWRERKSLMSHERAAWHARSCGFTLTVVNGGQVLHARIEQRLPHTGAVETLVARRVDAAGGGGSVTIIERQCAELRAWAEREAKRQARKRT